MQPVYVKPSPGGRIRMPERNFRPMDAEGAWVQRIDYYERLIVSGNLIITDPPPPEPTNPEPQPDAAPAAPKGTAARGASPSKEK